MRSRSFIVGLVLTGSCSPELPEAAKPPSQPASSVKSEGPGEVTPGASKLDKARKELDELQTKLAQAKDGNQKDLTMALEFQVKEQETKVKALVDELSNSEGNTSSLQGLQDQVQALKAELEQVRVIREAADAATKQKLAKDNEAKAAAEAQLKTQQDAQKQEAFKKCKDQEFQVMLSGIRKGDGPLDVSMNCERFLK